MPQHRPYAAGDGEYHARWKRLLHVDLRLREGTRPTAKTLARECGVSIKTIYRDIEALRSELGAPIEWDPERGGYSYRRGGFLVPAAALTEHELFAMMIAEQALHQYEGTPLHGYLKAAFDKVLKHLPGEAQGRHKQLAAVVRFGGLPAASLDPGVWATLLAAIQQRERVELEYLKPGARQASKRLLDPLQLVVRDREWFLLAWSVESQTPLTYYLPRIKSVRRTTERFEPPPGFQLERHWEGEFNALERNAPKRTVVLRFPPDHAHLADERPWAHTQKLHRHRDGSATVRFQTSALFEVRRAILRFGGVIEVVSPPELRREVAEAADLLAKNHADHATTKGERKLPRAASKPGRPTHARPRTRKRRTRGS
jgi:predicted DNA-binding transcriptional regulator YafY